MERIEELKKQLTANFNGNAWHGPSIMDVVEDLTPVISETKISGGIHRIADLVYHITTWKLLAVKRLQGDFTYQIDSPEKNFGRKGPIDEFELETLLMELSLAHEELLVSLDTKTDEFLDELVEGTDYTYSTLIQGVINHDAYHCGQMVLLKKMAAKVQPDDEY